MKKKALAIMFAVLNMKTVRKQITQAYLSAFFAAMAMMSATHAIEAASPGALDSTFGTAGKVITATRPDVFIVADVVAQADGKIVAVGSCAGTNVDVCLLRYQSDGS